MNDDFPGMSYGVLVRGVIGGLIVIAAIALLLLILGRPTP